MSHVMRKPDYCLCENKGADQLCSICIADQRLYFRNSDSTILLLFQSEISSCHLSSVTEQTGLCRTWTKTPKTGLFVSRLMYKTHDTDMLCTYLYFTTSGHMFDIVKGANLGAHFPTQFLIAYLEISFQ